MLGLHGADSLRGDRDALLETRRRTGLRRRKGIGGGGGVDYGGGGAAVGGGEGRWDRVCDMQRGDGNRKGRVRVAMSALVSLDVHLTVAGEEEHVPLLQVSVTVR